MVFLYEILTQPTVLFALVGVLALIMALRHSRHEEFTTQTLMATALLLAVAVVLQQLRLFHMPQGGSVTAGAMVPLLVIAYRFGMGTGFLAGFAYGLINLLQDPFILHPVQVLFDYPLPFMAMGLAGLSRNHLFWGTGLAFIARFACHFISGIVFFGSYAPEGTSPVMYSLMFNAAYLVPELVISCLLLKVLPLKKLVEKLEMAHA